MELQKTLRLCIVMVLSISFGFSAAPTIGVATAAGTFRVNNSEVEGNANIFDGAELRTTNSPSQVFLQNGSSVTLGMNSAGVLYRDRLLLEAGATKIQNLSGYTVQAASYRVQGERRSAAVVRFEAGHIQVASLAGSLTVLNSRGALLTRIGAGTASSFRKDPQTGGQEIPADTEDRRKNIALYTILIASMGGLGLAIDAILQPGAKSQVSP